MPTYQHLSRIYLSDDQFYELISEKNVSHRSLLMEARRRGLVFSSQSGNEGVRSMLALMPSDWQTVKGILTDIARPDPEESKTSRHLRGCDKDTNVHDLINKTRELRGDRYEEVYNTIQVSPTLTRVDITYVDVDYSRSQVYQRRVRKCAIEIENRDGDFRIIHNASQRAKDIAETIIKAGLRAPAAQNHTGERIALTSVRDPALRSNFFLELIKGIRGYKFENASDLSVDRRFARISDDDDSDDAASRSELENKLKASVNKIALTGEQVLSSDIYKQASLQGYYIYRISWTCQDEKDSQLHIDCEAGFDDALAGDSFSFDVLRRWADDANSPRRGRTLHMDDSVRRELNNLLDEAAYAALSKIVTGNQATGTPPTGSPI